MTGKVQGGQQLPALNYARVGNGAVLRCERFRMAYCHSVQYKGGTFCFTFGLLKEVIFLQGLLRLLHDLEAVHVLVSGSVWLFCTAVRYDVAFTWSPGSVLIRPVHMFTAELERWHPLA
jgi:hypothetical protein